MRKRIDFGAFLPDQPPTGPILSVAENVLPTANGYAPVPSFSAITDPLPEAFQGGASFIGTDGTAYLIAGTDAGLYRLAAGTWASLATTAAVGRWRFVQFGDLAIAVNGGETKQVDLAAGTGSALANAPTGTSIAVAGTAHVVIGQADGNRLLVQWCAFNNPTGWTDAVDQAGSQPMLDGGEVMGLASGEYVIILQRFALTRMSLTGDNTAPFEFQQITSNFGCASKASIAQAGRTVFFLSDRGFMALEDGTTTRPIGNEKIDASFRAVVAQADYEKLHTAIDPKRSLVLWGIPGTPGTIWGYNWVLDRWFTLSFAFTGLFSGYETSLTLEQVSAIYPNLDAMTFSLDDARFSGGDPRLYVVGAGGAVGSLSGPNLSATLTMGWVEPFGTTRAAVRGVWPVTDATGRMTVTLDARQRVGGENVTRATDSIQPSGKTPIRQTGRTFRITWQAARGLSWSYVQGLEIEADGLGER